jgi:hypothetical protein
MLTGSCIVARPQVGPRTEISTRTGEDHATIIGRRRNLAEGREKLTPHDVVCRILLRGTIECDGDDAVGPVDGDCLECVGCHDPTIHNDAVGFDATRKRVKRRTDIVFVAAALVVALSLVAWAFLG